MYHCCRRPDTVREMSRPAALPRRPQNFRREQQALEDERAEIEQRNLRGIPTTDGKLLSGCSNQARYHLIVRA